MQKIGNHYDIKVILNLGVWWGFTIFYLGDKKRDLGMRLVINWYGFHLGQGCCVHSVFRQETFLLRCLPRRVG